ncbi:MAG TPA: hypothetical protein VN048_04775, partial [Verrucomicrobiae bacterium]|nr:hypothetical protein [Verrucomicrobiae bacterium]
FSQLFTEPFDSWLARVDGKVVSTFVLNLRAGNKPTEWVVVRLSPPASMAAAANSPADAHAGDGPVKIKSSPRVAPGIKVPA